MKYRRLNPGEVVQEGDEVWLSDVEEWVNTNSPGKRVDTNLPYRRLLSEGQLNDSHAERKP